MDVLQGEVPSAVGLLISGTLWWSLASPSGRCGEGACATGVQQWAGSGE